MSTRNQVFISGTYRDLQRERREAMFALLEVDAIPAGMELFDASNDDQWTYIQKVIDSCDYYILIIGSRYGSISSDGRSYTELEFDYAQTRGLPTLAFLKRLRRPPADSEREPLERFRSRVQSSGRMCRDFRGPDQLRGLVSSAYQKVVRDYPAKGWIRGDQAFTDDLKAEMDRLRGERASLEEQVRAMRFEPIPHLEEYAQLDDNHTFDLDVDDPMDGEVRREHVGTSWRKVFKALAPWMFRAVANDQQIDEAILASFVHEVSNGEELVRVPPPTRHEILFHLQAIGLIDYGSTQVGIGWTLTHRGEAELRRVMAVRRR